MTALCDIMRDQAIAAPPQGWSVAVFGRNEAGRIAACLRAIARAGRDAPGLHGPDLHVLESHVPDLHISVLLNGCTDGSAGLARTALREAGLQGAVWHVPHADKSHALNLFLHELRPPAALYFCVDAYAEVRPDSLQALARTLDARPAALAAAAVPSTGRSAPALRRSMLEEPGLHGSLFALRGSFVDRLAQAGLRLPVGLYRGDGLLGAAVLHDLDAASGGWDTRRIAVVPEASWAAPQLQPWRWSDLRRHLRRLVQQGRGRLESAALREAIYARGFAGLPQDADRMILDWIAADPAARTPSLHRDPFARLALRRIRQSVAPSADALRPCLLSRGAPR